MRDLIESEIDTVFGGSAVGDGAACIAGGAAAVLGLGTAETGIGVAIAIAGAAAAAGACYDFGVDVGNALGGGRPLNITIHED